MFKFSTAAFYIFLWIWSYEKKDDLEYPICKKGSGWQSMWLVSEAWKGKLPPPAATVAAELLELHKLSIALRLNPSDSSWKIWFHQINE